MKSALMIITRNDGDKTVIVFVDANGSVECRGNPIDHEVARALCDAAEVLVRLANQNLEGGRRCTILHTIVTSERDDQK